MHDSKASEYMKDWIDSASPSSGLDEYYEDGDELDELDEQLGESVENCLGLAESSCETPNPSS